jgi:hypothetical protein
MGSVGINLLTLLLSAVGSDCWQLLAKSLNRHDRLDDPKALICSMSKPRFAEFVQVTQIRGS